MTAALTARAAVPGCRPAMVREKAPCRLRAHRESARPPTAHAALRSPPSDCLSGPTMPATKARRCEPRNGLARKCQALLQRRHAAVARHQQDPHVGPFLNDLGCELDARQPGHLEIRHQKMNLGLAITRAPESLSAIPGRQDRVLTVCQEASNKVAEG
jgi:hypothetical protein